MTTPSIKEALEHARARFDCLAEDFAAKGQDVDRAMCEVDAGRMGQALATLSQPSGEKREAIARNNQALSLEFCKSSFQKRFDISDSRTKEYVECIADLLNMATDFASGLVQDEAWDSRAEFEKVWAKRPWLTYEESDKDRAFRWWSEAIRSARDRGAES